MGDEGYDQFSTENDYEGGRWIGGEFYYENKVPKRRFTKDDAIYGVFNDESSSDDDRSNKRAKRADKNLGRPVAFVSTGKILGGDKPANGSPEKSDEDEDEDMGEYSGLGSQKKKKKKKKKKQSEDVPFDLPTKFGSSKSKRQSDQYIGATEPETTTVKPAFEKFTKGFGSKMLEKMGFTGGGLGKHGQGIDAPIEAKLRPKNLGLGNIDEKTEQQRETERKQAALKKLAQEAIESGSESSESETEGKPKHWQKGAAPRKKPTTVYEILNRDEEDRPQKVVDMRGPQVRVLASLADANAQAADAKKKAGPLPELRFNVRMLVDLAEVKVQNADRRTKQEKDHLAILAREKARMEDQVAAEAKRIERLQDLLEIIAKCQERVQAGELTLEGIRKVFEMFRKKFKEEYVMHKLKYSALELVGPLLKNYMASWDPVLEPTYGSDIFGQWKDLDDDMPTDYSEYDDFEYGRGRESDKEMGVYMQLVMDVFMPKLRSWIANQWNARNYDPVIQIIASWGPILPPSVLDNILDQLVIPKLFREVENWNPRVDPVPIHAWLHPWLHLEILRTRMEPLYATIRHKLSLVLHDWNPADPSAHAILIPWKNVFEPASMEALLVRCIMPKLLFTLRDFVINPLRQEIEPIRWVMLWTDLIPIHHLVSLLESEFFPKWLTVLYQWLMSKPDYEQVSGWYIGWKKMFPPEIVNHDRVRTQFNLALEAMNSAVTGNFGPPPTAFQQPPQPYNPPPPTQPPPPTPPPPSTPPPLSSLPSDLSLKQMVEALAMQQNISFLPRRRHENGAQIYAFGNVQVYLEKGRVWAQDGNNWQPITPDALLARARS